VNIGRDSLGAGKYVEGTLVDNKVCEVNKSGIASAPDTVKRDIVDDAGSGYFWKK